MAKDEITPIREKLILALAENRMVVSRAAKALGINHATALYHVKMIKAITGKNPVEFYDLCELVDMVKPQKIKVVFKPDGIHEMSPHIYTEELNLRNVSVQVLKCKVCGKVSVGWKRQDNTEEVY